MLFRVLLLSSLLPLQVQCVPAFSASIPVQRNFDMAPQAPLATVYSVSASSDPAPNSSAVHTFSLVGSTGPLVMAYYASWAGDQFPPANIDFASFDWIDFAFATPDANFGIGWESPDSPGLLQELVKSAHDADIKVKLSVGGWTGSKYFSSAVATDESRETFASNIKDVYEKFDLDGIDIDWEYPGREGNEGNIIDPEHDSSNFLSFLQVLRYVLPADARITAAATTVPFTDASGKPLEDVSSFVGVLDWVLLMNYDLWGPSDVGPNAPLSDNCDNSTQPEANAVAGFNAWTSAGFPANKLVLGLPSYGYVYKSDAHRLRQRANIKSRDQGVAVMATDDSQVLFRELVGQGALALAPASGGRRPPKFDGAGGFVRHWDRCSSTPFLRSTWAGQVIAYDDPESLAMKAEFVRQTGMLGVNIFDTHGDTDEWHLTDTVQKAVKGFYDFEGTGV